MKKILFIAASLLLLGAGCGPQTAAPSTTTPAQQQPAPAANAPATGTPAAKADTRTVKFTKDAKFEPAPVAIHVGGTVTWVNESSQNVWVASTPYPTHADYPEFDSKVAIAPGKSWSFTFDKAGTWLYINHLQPGVQGRVDVTPWP